MNVCKWSVTAVLFLLSVTALAQSSMQGIGSSIGSAMGTGSKGNTSEQPVKERPKEPADTTLWHGQFVGLNLVPAIKATFSPNWGIQLQYNCNLYNRFFPAAELGYARLQGTRDLNSYQAGLFGQSLTTLYRGSGFYGKIGIDVPISKKGPDANNMFFVGLRYAAAVYDYELLTVPFWPNYWTDAYSMSITDQHSLAHWLELVAGLRVEITPSISLGWTFYYKHLFGRKDTGTSVAPYVPGYGAADNWVPAFGVWFYWHLPW